MRVIWTPRDGDRREFTFRVEELGPTEYEPVEDAGGSSWDNLEDFEKRIRSGSRKAWRVALWVCLRREHSGLALEDVQPRADEIEMGYEPAEELLIAELILADPALPAEKRSFWEAQMPGLRAAAGKGEPGTGPGPSPTLDAPTDGTSPTSSA